MRTAAAAVAAVAAAALWTVRRRGGERSRRTPQEQLVEAVLAALAALEVGGETDRLVVGLAGPPGAGKTTTAAAAVELLERRGVRAVAVPMDGYHYTRAELDAMPNAREAHEKRGAHWTFDAERFARDLEASSKAETFSFPGFDHAMGDPTPNGAVVTREHRVVIVEGNYLLLDDPAPWRRARACFGLTAYLDVPLDVARDRLARHHARVWNWDLDRAFARVDSSDAANMLVARASMQNAHVVLAG